MNTSRGVDNLKKKQDKTCKVVRAGFNAAPKWR